MSTILSIIAYSLGDWLWDTISNKYIKYIYINTIWIKKPINLICIHLIVYYIESNLVGSRAYTNRKEDRDA